MCKGVVRGQQVVQQPTAVPATTITRDKPITVADVQRVHYMVERCILRCMSRQETTNYLQRLGVDPCFTSIVWQKLEEQNQEFFKDYNAKLSVLSSLARMEAVAV